MPTPPAFDHLAVKVPNLDEQVDRLVNHLGMAVQLRMEGFAVVIDPATGIKLELSASEDGDVHLRHFGFRADDVDDSHEHLLAVGMETSQAPHRQDYAGMYTSFLTEPGTVEVQLVKYDA